MVYLHYNMLNQFYNFNTNLFHDAYVKLDSPFKFCRIMIPTAKEPAFPNWTFIDGLLPNNHPIFYGHLINNYCFEMEPTIMFIYFNNKTKKRFCPFCFETFSQQEREELDWHSMAKFNLHTKCHKCGVELIKPRCKSTDCLLCIEEFIVSRKAILRNEEVIVTNHS